MFKIYIKDLHIHYNGRKAKGVAPYQNARLEQVKGDNTRVQIHVAGILNFTTFEEYSVQSIVDEFGKPYGTTFEEFKAGLYVNVQGSPIYPIQCALDEVYENDVDWVNSVFTGWDGEPRNLFRNVNDGGITWTGSDNPKSFTLKLIRTRQMRVFGIGTNVDNFSNINAIVSGSAATPRGILELKEFTKKENSVVYDKELFTINSITVEFHTSDVVTVTNLFLKNVPSERRQGYTHKFGFNPDVDSGQTEAVWNLGGQYTFTTVPQKYYISSSSTLDQTQEISVETVCIWNDGTYDYTRVVETKVTLNGQVPVLIDTQIDAVGVNCIASNRAFNTTPPPLDGDIYIYEEAALPNVTGGIPNDLSYVRSVITAGEEQTEQAIYTLAQLTKSGQTIALADIPIWEAALVRNRSAAAVAKLRVQEFGQTFRNRDVSGVGESIKAGSNFGKNTPFLIYPGTNVLIEISEVTTNNCAFAGTFTVIPTVL